METFTGFIEDDRYSTPTVMFFMARGERQARRLADRDLSANPHHRTFEVRDGQDRLIFIAARDRERDGARRGDRLGAPAPPKRPGFG